MSGRTLCECVRAQKTLKGVNAGYEFENCLDEGRGRGNRL